MTKEMVHKYLNLFGGAENLETIHLDNPGHICLYSHYLLFDDIDQILFAVDRHGTDFIPSIMNARALRNNPYVMTIPYEVIQGFSFRMRDIDSINLGFIQPYLEDIANYEQ